MEPESTAEETARRQARTLEEADVKALFREFRAARELDADARKGYQEARNLASGRAFRNWASDANLIGTFLDVLVSFLYAQNPDIDVRAAPQVGGPAPEAVDFAQTLSVVLTRLWRRAGIKRELHKLVRSALTTGGGWLKVLPDKGIGPQTRHRRDTLAADAEALRAASQALEAEDAPSADDRQALIASIERLTAQVLDESRHREKQNHPGVVIDYERPENLQVSADAMTLADYGKADWVAHLLLVDFASLGERFPALTAQDRKAARIFGERRPGMDPEEEPAAWFDRHAETPGQSPQKGQFVRVIELWDRRDGFVKTLIEGVPVYAEPPYPSPWASSRFFPFFYLEFFPVDGSRHPQSLPRRLKKLQEEYSSRRSNGRLTAERSVPGLLFNRRSLHPEDVKRLETSVHLEMVGLDSPTGDDVRKLFAPKPVPAVDPLVFDTRAVTADMERVSGVQEALVQSNVRAKTATEARIQQSGFASRSSADRDAVEDLLNELAHYTAELSVQTLTVEHAQRLAGPQAFWLPGMEVHDLDALVRVQITAGSTGKPDRDREQKNWTVALPLVQNVLLQIQQAQQQNNAPMAEAMINLLKETFRRLDERIDVERLVPQGPMPAAGPATPAAPAPDTPGVSGGEPPQSSAEANVLV